jgi:hypothetical protein
LLLSPLPPLAPRPTHLSLSLLMSSRPRLLASQSSLPKRRRHLCLSPQQSTRPPLPLDRVSSVGRVRGSRATQRMTAPALRQAPRLQHRGIPRPCAHQTSTDHLSPKPRRALLLHKRPSKPRARARRRSDGSLDMESDWERLVEQLAAEVDKRASADQQRGGDWLYSSSE